MGTVLGKFTEQTYALLRIVAGFLFLCHGLQKFGMFGGVDGSGGSPPTFSLFWFAGVIEVAVGVLLIIGLFAAWAAFLGSGEMAVAFFYVHAKQGLLPLLNGGELAVLYCFVFLYMAARGAGIWSIDAARGKG